ncbi:MAG TPA: SCO family protein [Lysobacter sp.]|nr:SCO family protein [Lysobacter sp.]
MNKFVRFFVPLAAACCATLAFAAPSKPAPLPGDSVYQLRLPLTGQDGRTADWRALRGKPRMVAMFYTSCQYMCPLIVESGKAVEHQLDAAQRARLGVVLISMDPARDTPAALRKVATARGVDDGRWLLAAPPAAKVREVAGVLGVRYKQLPNGDFNHSSVLILLDADGRIVARTEKIGSTPDPDFLAAVRKTVGG